MASRGRKASPHPYYGASAADVVRNLESLSAWLRTLSIRSADDIAKAWKESWTRLHPDRAAQCALDLALWDWLARKEGVTVTELAHGHVPQRVMSFATIGLSTKEELDEKIAELEGFPRVKIKSDATADLEPARRVERMRAALAIDANCAWSTSTLPALSAGFSSLGAEFIEQPLPIALDRELIRGSYPIPIIADESCVLEEDVDRLSLNFDGINVKLVKCGGLTPALRMVQRANKLGMRTMVGCMLEPASSLPQVISPRSTRTTPTSTGPGSLPTIRALAGSSSVESFTLHKQWVSGPNRAIGYRAHAPDDCQLNQIGRRRCEIDSPRDAHL